MLKSKLLNRVSYSKFVNYLGLRTFLSEAYSCQNVWERRLTKPPLKGLKMDEFFINADKKFQTKRLTSGVEIDMFANNITNEAQLEELEHLLFRFRKTKRSIEMMDSTHHAIVKAFLKFQNYDSLFHILNNRENYGVFPDHYTYNLLMNNFLKLERFADAAEIAVMMMLQEDFSNSICRILSLYSCYMFLSNCSLDTFWHKPEEQEVEEKVETQQEGGDGDEEEEVYVRIPFLRNPWFDDHFEIKDPKQLIGKTLYLVGLHENNVLGRTSQILGLSMYGKWDKAQKILESMSKSTSSPPLLLEEGILKVKENLADIPDENSNKTGLIQAFEEKFSLLHQENRIGSSDLICECKKELERISVDESSDIKAQEELFSKWEQYRQEALLKEEKEVDKEKRLEIIAQKKEELLWKEKLFFFFENKNEILDELEEVNKIMEQQKEQVSKTDSYMPPEITKKKPLKISQLRKKAMVKQLT